MNTSDDDNDERDEDREDPFNRGSRRGGANKYDEVHP